MSAEQIFGSLSALALAVMAYLIKEIASLKAENKELRNDNEVLRSSIIQLATAIKLTNTIEDSSYLHKVSAEVLNNIQKKSS